jgi:tRNA nucleotidyltransferase (CCA-adding enzyme)
MDFDSLASAMAARRLYSDPVVLQCGTMDSNVKEFHQLYKDFFPLLKASQVDFSQARRLIYVDVHSNRQLGGCAKKLEELDIERHIWDHHQVSPDKVEASFEMIEPVGSATTLLVEELMKRGRTIEQPEATLFTLGIYEDTGRLSYSGTTPRDAAAVSWLLANGSNLEIVSRFLVFSLSEQQRELLKKLATASQQREVKGYRFTIAAASVEQYVDEIALLTRKLLEVENTDAVITLTQVKNRTYLIGRSNVPGIDLGGIARAFGGGGHSGAASAMLKDGRSLALLEIELIKAIENSLQPELKARDIMAFPVHHLPDHFPVSFAMERMVKLGLSGIVAVDDDGNITGILGRKDVDKALQHELGHAPIKGIMTNRVITISPEASMREMQQAIIRNNISRLPVIDNGELVGIVTRSDVLTSMCGVAASESNPGSEEAPPGPKAGEVDFSLLPKDLLDLLYRIGQLGDAENVNIFLVGGVVRDLVRFSLAGRKGKLLRKQLKDVDIIAEGDGVPFARTLATELNAEITVHDQFQTAVLSFPKGQHIDIASTRSEFYERPASLPVVEHSSLRQDLYRRDFTFNAMALTLNWRQFGRLADFYGGMADLQDGQVRVLHSMSFIDDPTRILRAIRFSRRFGFKVEPRTRQLMLETVQMGIFNETYNQRMLLELRRTLREPNAPQMLGDFRELGLEKLIFPDLSLDAQAVPRAGRILKAIKKYQPLLETEKLDVTIVLEQNFLSNLVWREIRQFCESYNLDLSRRGILRSTAKDHIGPVRDEILAGAPRSVVYSRLKNFKPEALVYLLAYDEKPVLLPAVKNFLEDRKKETLLSGKDLVEMGFKPSPRFKKVLDRLLMARIDGRISTLEEERKLAKSLMKEDRRTSGPARRKK